VARAVLPPEAMSSSDPAPAPYRIVVGFDFSELAARALQEALVFADRRYPSEVHLVTIGQTEGPKIRLPDGSDAAIEEVAREKVRQEVAKITDAFRQKHGPVRLDKIAVYLLSGAPPGKEGPLVAELATALDADLIIVGTHGRKGIQRLVLGSVAEQVMRHATTNVYVIRPRDFVGGEKVPSVEPPLLPGQAHAHHMEHRRVYHHLDALPTSQRTMPVT